VCVCVLWCVCGVWCVCVCVCAVVCVWCVVCGVCVCSVSVCMTGYVLADDGVTIRLCKGLILFHIQTCYPLRRFRPQLTVRFYLSTNTVFDNCTDNV